MGSTIAFLNKKGGVGKSSACHHLAGTLASGGRKILLADNDPQASLTRGFFGPEATDRIGRTDSIAALYDPDFIPMPEALIRPSGIERIWIVPGSEHATRYNMIPPEGWADHELGIREFVEEVRGEFDLILIDCPPNLHLCSWAALAAADYLVIPVQAEDYGAQGISAVLAWTNKARTEVNPALACLGVLLTMYDKRLGIHLAYEGTLRDMLGEDIFENTMPLAKDFKEAVASRLPISHFKPKGVAGKATEAVAAELLERIAAREQERAAFRCGTAPQDGERRIAS